MAVRQGRWSRLLSTFVLTAAIAGGVLAARSTETRYIVQTGQADTAAQEVTLAGGRVEERLSLIGGVVASLDSVAAAQLAAHGVRLTPDRAVMAAEVVEPAAQNSDGSKDFPLYPALATGTDQLHRQNVSTTRSQCKNQQVTALGGQEAKALEGWGVTVAVVDSGFMKMHDDSSWTYRDPMSGVLYAENAEGRCIIYRDFLPASTKYDNTTRTNSTDQNGHGTHVAATIADNRSTVLTPGQLAAPVGVAPKVNLMIARVLRADGSGTYGDVIRAIEWVVANKETYNVRVLNLSLYTPVTGPYWADPINQAVMAAWKAGIVVVVAAGNSGPDAATITVPGNNPYAISVGAIRSARYSLSNMDELAPYSSRGPTESAFVKPDVLVPASRTIAPVPNNSTLARAIPQARIQEQADVSFGIGRPSYKHTYFQLSGTSMAAAQVSGIAALLLQADPSLTNDQVKYRLLDTALPAVDASTNKLRYSIWEQGAGRIDAAAAIANTSRIAANQGLNVTADLTTETHYWGYTVWDATAHEFKLVDPSSGKPVDVWSGAGHVWSGAGHVWSGAGHVWSGAGHVWSGAGHVWSGNSTAAWAAQTSLWAGAGHVWSGSTPVVDLNAASHSEAITPNETVYRVAVPILKRR